MRLRKAIPVLAVAVVLLFVGMAQAEMYFEGYMGGAFPLSADKEGFFVVPGSTPTSGAILGGRINGGFKPAFQGGGKLGLWFDRSGVLSGINFKPWMKYFGFYMDVSYHRLDVGREDDIGALFVYGPNGKFFTAKSFPFSTEGECFTLGFMFAARYGFLKDSEVPFGRLQPYLAVGPAVLFTWQQVNFNNFKLASQNSVNVGPAVEAGLRWMALKNVSVDVSFKYRYAHPTYTYNYRLSPFLTQSVTVGNNLNIMSFQVGAAYHF